MQHRTLGDLRASDGDYPDAGYFVALEGDTIVATASARPEHPAWPTDARNPWRVRGVVTIDRLRRHGVATRLMEAVLDHIRHNGGDLAWCNVRMTAVPFYENLGFSPRGHMCEDPDTGPHTSMVMWLVSHASSA
jgi:GNAT superfamily N-acetyltransferase